MERSSSFIAAIVRQSKLWYYPRVRVTMPMLPYSSEFDAYRDRLLVSTLAEELVLLLDKVCHAQRPVRVLGVDLRLDVPQDLASRIRALHEVEEFPKRRDTRTRVCQLKCYKYTNTPYARAYTSALPDSDLQRSRNKVRTIAILPF